MKEKKRGNINDERILRKRQITWKEFSLVDYLTLLDGWMFVKEFKGERNVCV